MRVEELGRCVSVINDGYLLLIYDVYEAGSEDALACKDFRSMIIKMGFRRVQYSFYKKYLRDLKSAESEIKEIERIAPLNSNIQIIKLTAMQLDKFVIAVRGEDLSSENDRKEYVEY